MKPPKGGTPNEALKNPMGIRLERLGCGTRRKPPEGGTPNNHSKSVWRGQGQVVVLACERDYAATFWGFCISIDGNFYENFAKN